MLERGRESDFRIPLTSELNNSKSVDWMNIPINEIIVKLNHPGEVV